MVVVAATSFEPLTLSISLSFQLHKSLPSSLFSYKPFELGFTLWKLSSDRL